MGIFRVLQNKLMEIAHKSLNNEVTKLEELKKIIESGKATDEILCSYLSCVEKCAVIMNAIEKMAKSLQSGTGESFRSIKMYHQLLNKIDEISSSSKKLSSEVNSNKTEKNNFPLDNLCNLRFIGQSAIQKCDNFPYDSNGTERAIDTIQAQKALSHAEYAELSDTEDKNLENIDAILAEIESYKKN